jgi:hypothetical protein
MGYKRKMSYSHYSYIQSYSITFNIQSYKCIQLLVRLLNSSSLYLSSHVRQTGGIYAVIYYPVVGFLPNFVWLTMEHYHELLWMLQALVTLHPLG